MKKRIGLLTAIAVLLVCAAALADISVNEKNFPDRNFRNYITEEFDRDGDHKLTSEEIDSIRKIKCKGKGIASLKGIEKFTALRVLDCSNNKLTELDVSGNLKLQEITFSRNKVKKADFSANRDLNYIECYDNSLTSLNVSRNTSLLTLACGGNRLSGVKLPASRYLNWVDVSMNRITVLDISNAPALQKLVRGTSPTAYQFGDNGYTRNWVRGDDSLAADKNVKITAGGSTLAKAEELKKYKYNGLVYKLNNTKLTASVTGVTDKNRKSLIIEDRIRIQGKTYTVTSIADKALKGMARLEALQIGKNVAKIGKNACSSCKKLWYVDFRGSKLKKVGAGAFSGTKSNILFKCPAGKASSYKKLLKASGVPKNARYKKR